MRLGMYRVSYGEAHVRWARHFCTPQGEDAGLVDRERLGWHRDHAALEDTRRACDVLRMRASEGHN